MGIVLVSIDLKLSNLNSDLINVENRLGYEEVNVILTSNQQIKMAMSELSKEIVLSLDDSLDISFFQDFTNVIVVDAIFALSKGKLSKAELYSLTDEELSNKLEDADEEFRSKQHELVGEKKELKQKINDWTFYRNLTYFLAVIFQIIILIVGFFIERNKN